MKSATLFIADRKAYWEQTLIEAWTWLNRMQRKNFGPRIVSKHLWSSITYTPLAIRITAHCKDASLLMQYSATLISSKNTSKLNFWGQTCVVWKWKLKMLWSALLLYKAWLPAMGHPGHLSLSRIFDANTYSRWRGQEASWQKRFPFNSEMIMTPLALLGWRFICVFSYVSCPNFSSWFDL